MAEYVRTINQIEEDIRNTKQQDCGPLYKELEEAQARRDKMKAAVVPGVPEKPQPGEPEKPHFGHTGPA